MEHKEFVFIITTSTENIEKAAGALQLAANMGTYGAKVDFFLMNEGAFLAKKGYAESVREQKAFSPVSDLIKILVEDLNCRFYVCASCVKPYGLEGAEMIQNAEIRPGSYLGELLMNRQGLTFQSGTMNGSNMKNIANFLFEAGMLKRTPRSGFQFLGSGAESVAEHIFRTTYIGYALGRMNERVNVDRLIKMCLFHDLPEARTGDLNYVNKKYVSADEERAVKDLSENLPFGEEIRELIEEYEEGRTIESRLARDADQLEMILALKEYQDLGNKYAEEWLEYSLKRLKTESAKKLAVSILETDSSLWWFKDKGDWWVRGGKEK